jgi:hypothetical protein
MKPVDGIFSSQDTMNGYAWIEFIATRISPRADLLVESLEDAVEQYAGRYPLKVRMQSMLADYELNGPLRLPLDDRHRVEVFSTA